MNEIVKPLSSLILLAAQIREESYNQELHDQHLKEGKPKTILDFHLYYTKTIEECCKEAVEQLRAEPEVASMVHFLLSNSWNDSIFWAMKQNLDETPEYAFRFFVN